jgi:hypothetical protein
LQATPVAADLYLAIQAGKMNEFQDVWTKMHAAGTLSSSSIPSKAIWHAVYGHRTDILLWILKQDFPIDSSAFKKASSNEERDVVQFIQTLYHPVPIEVCKALIDRKYGINNVKSMSSLLIAMGRSDLVVYAVSRGYLLYANLYSSEIINTYFTVQKIQQISDPPIHGLNQLTVALIKFQALDQLRELRNGKHKGLSLPMFSYQSCVKRLSAALQAGWVEGAEFFFQVLREQKPYFKLKHDHTNAALSCGSHEILRWAYEHGAPRRPPVKYEDGPFHPIPF